MIEARKTDRQSHSHQTSGLEQPKAEEAILRDIPLCTIGDAVTSFLEVPDKFTKGLGIVSRFEMSHLAEWGDSSCLEWQNKSVWYVFLPFIILSYIFAKGN